MFKDSNILNERMNKSNPFKIPEDYFDRFEVEMANRMEVPHSKKTSNFRISPRSIALMAAASLALFVIVKGVMFFQTNGRSSVEMTQNTNMEIIIANEVSDIELITKMEMYQTEDTKHDSLRLQKNIKSDQIIDFLLAENINLQTIEDEF